MRRRRAMPETLPDPHMDAGEFRDLLRQIGLSQTDFATYIGARSARSIRRYAAGDVRIPGGIAVLLRLLVKEAGGDLKEIGDTPKQALTTYGD